MASTSSQTPSSSTSSSTPTKWDVFLSFRGTDTRHGFTGHLYSALDRYNIRTFMDDPELRCGEVISDTLLQAIQESRTYIVVLSENYASSRWCLDELVEILNCSKTMQRVIIPVFYNIDPSVVRYQTGSFEKAFAKHEVRLAGELERVENSRVATQCIDWLFRCFTTFFHQFYIRFQSDTCAEHEVRFSGEIERVKNWRVTLTQVADNSGRHIDGKRPEAAIVNEIVDEILLQIKPTALDVARYPVGLNSRVDDITALLSDSTKGVIKIGIYGMGGVGKTTLAKAVFNDQLLLGSFKGSCFLADVRETSGKKGLESLQQQLINDVLKSKDKFDVTSVAQGIKLIEARICSTKILVVIDDLDNHNEFESLVRPFASGSVVIITTRDEETLDSIEVETKYRYKVNELGDAESETLFFRHALGDTTPDNTQMILSEDILRLAGGLPLALVVFGSYLYKKSEGRWKSYIETLQRNPNSTIQQRLMISLNALESDDPLLKKMFLDIACFFIGRDKEVVVEILDTYYSNADDKIDILMKKCLLTINDDNEFRMHDLLQDVGKEIARNNSRDEPGKYSRLWVPKDVCYVLEEHKGTEAIEGIVLHPKDPFKEVSDSVKEVSLAMETFKRMSKLRFLSFDDINLSGKFERTLVDLRWFCWRGCPLKCLPFDFRPQKIVILELPHSKMTTMWEVNKVQNAFEKLKTLNMSFSRDLTTTPDFRRLPCLRKLNFDGCTSLKEVHNSIGSLVSLVSLNLNNCENLRSLPDTICNLRALEVLNITCCTKVKELPEELGKIESLKELDAGWLAVSKLPDSICNMRSLEILDISDCDELERLPDQLWKLTRLLSLDVSNHCGASLLKLPDIESSQTSLSLARLKLYGSKIIALPSGISLLSNLKILYLDACDHLLSIAELPPNLRYINGSNCTSLERLNLCNLKLLKILELSGCSALTEILGLGDLNSLKRMRLQGCPFSLPALTLTEPLFQIYSGFEQKVNIWLEAEKFPDWMIQSVQWSTYIDHNKFPNWFIQLQWPYMDEAEETNYLKFRPEISSSVKLKPNLSHNYLGMILCFEWRGYGDQPDYSVMTSASNKFTDKSFGSGIVMVPRSIFTVTDADHTIKFRSSACRHWIRLLYKNEDDSTSVNVEDEQTTPWPVIWK